MKKTTDNQDCNPLCRKCVRSCRQPLSVTLCDCRRFTPFPFKIAAAPTEQLGLFSSDNDSAD